VTECVSVSLSVYLCVCVCVYTHIDTYIYNESVNRLEVGMKKRTYVRVLLARLY
jgi:hypothetical protein